MKAFSAAALLVPLAAPPASAQTPTFTYELRIVADGEAGAPNLPGTDVLPFSADATAVGFWVQARVRVDNPTTTVANRGIGRFTSPAGGTSVISMSDPAGGSTISRGRVGSSSDANTGAPITLFGRGIGLRVDRLPDAGSFDVGGVPDNVSSDWHTADQNGTGATAFPASTGNDHGNVDTAADRIFGFDVYIGPATGSQVPIAAGGAVFSQWYNLYRFVFTSDQVVFGRTITLSTSGQLSTLTRSINVGGGIFLVQLGGGQAVAATRTLVWVPAPASAPLLLVGGLAVRRRR